MWNRLGEMLLAGVVLAFAGHACLTRIHRDSTPLKRRLGALVLTCALLGSAGAGAAGVIATRNAPAGVPQYLPAWCLARLVVDLGSGNLLQWIALWMVREPPEEEVRGPNSPRNP